MKDNDPGMIEEVQGQQEKFVNTEDERSMIKHRGI